jgi:hypothetical protein
MSPTAVPSAITDSRLDIFSSQLRLGRTLRKNANVLLLCKLVAKKSSTASAVKAGNL